MTVLNLKPGYWFVLPFTFFFQTVLAQCDTDFSLEHKHYFDQLLSTRESSDDRSMVVEVPLAFHIETVNGNPVYRAANIAGEIAACNLWFADGNIEVVQCGEAFYYEQGTSYQSINHVINVAIATSYDGCGVWWGSITINPTCSLPFDEILAHEVGHGIGLPHTHGYTNYGTTDELVDGSNCETHGDHFCDTPADPNILGLVNGSCIYTGSLTDANGDFYVPNTGNIMSYTNGGCRDHFSTDQLDRMYDVATASNFYCCLTPQPAEQTVSTCNGMTATFDTAVAVDTVRWYDVPAGGVPIYQGLSFTTPPLANSESYYCEAVQGCVSDRTRMFAEV
jgi:hypothetical protein